MENETNDSICHCGCCGKIYNIYDHVECPHCHEDDWKRDEDHEPFLGMVDVCSELLDKYTKEQIQVLIDLLNNDLDLAMDVIPKEPRRETESMFTAMANFRSRCREKEIDKEERARIEWMQASGKYHYIG